MESSQIISILFFLAFGSAIAAFFKNLARKTQHALGLGHSMTVTERSGKTNALSNVMTTLKTTTIKHALERLQRASLPSVAVDFRSLQDKEAKVMGGDNQSKARYAINTFRAHAKGQMDYLTKEKDLAERSGMATAGLEDFDAFISDFLNNQVQGKIPHHAAQLKTFYDHCPPHDDEFLIGWGDRIVFTSARIVLLTEGSQPTILADIPTTEIANYVASDG